MKQFLKSLTILILIGIMQSIFLSQLSTPTFADDTPTPVPAGNGPTPTGTQVVINNTVKQNSAVTFNILNCRSSQTTGPNTPTGTPVNGDYAVLHWKKRGNRTNDEYRDVPINNGSGNFVHTPGFSTGTYDVEVDCGTQTPFTYIFSATDSSTNTTITIDFDNPDNGTATDIINVGPPPPPPCAEGVGSTASNSDGNRCLKVNTAIGTISTNPSDFVSQIFAVALSLAGGIALILIIYGGYRLLISQGNPEAVKNAREIITSAVVGLLFLIFSLVILEVIGVDILHIPGLSNAG